MKTGLLWYDGSGRDLAEKVALAAVRYRKKFGAMPNTCYVHPSAMKGNGEAKTVGDVCVMALPSVLRHHFWIGIEEKGK